MFKCEVTGKISKSGEKLNRLVIKNREKKYIQRIWEDNQLMDVEIGRGYETVKEINASDEVMKLYQQMIENGTVENFISKF